MPTDAEFRAALRKYGWLRDDGDGEKMHHHREPLASSEDNRCNHDEGDGPCRLNKNHTGACLPEFDDDEENS